MTEYSLQKIIPIYNNDEKLDEINRLLDILSKRKRCSILIAMLLVFQKYNFQKLLKEFLFEGVQQIIHNNPYKVVSFTGVPFSVKNCLMGMRVIIGKHRMFKREMIDGYEYLSVQLVYTCIFLTDEIAKITKGAKNRKPVHSSLLDELDIVENGNTLDINNDTNNNISNNNIDDNNTLINPIFKKDDDDQIINDNNNINNNTALEYDQKYSETYSGGYDNEYKGYDNNIISLGESEESEDYGKGRKNKNYSKLKKKSYHKNNNHNNALYNNKRHNANNIFANIFYPKDSNYFRCSLQDYLNLWYFDKSSPVNIYLKNNEQKISELKNIFDKLEMVGIKCQNYLLDLMKYIPELNKAYAANSEKKEKNEMNIKVNILNDELKESKEILEKIENMNKVYKEYENKSQLLINIFQRIKTTVDNIKQSSINGEKLFLKDDLNYLQKINNRYNDLILEILPLFKKIYEYNKVSRLKNISENLENVNNNLKENNLSFKFFANFIENWCGLFPSESKNMNTVNDLLTNYSISDREREEKFIEIISKEKENLINSIEQFIKDY